MTLLNLAIFIFAIYLPNYNCNLNQILEGLHSSPHALYLLICSVLIIKVVSSSITKYILQFSHQAPLNATNYRKFSTSFKFYLECSLITFFLTSLTPLQLSLPEKGAFFDLTFPLSNNIITNMLLPFLYLSMSIFLVLVAINQLKIGKHIIPLKEIHILSTTLIMLWLSISLLHTIPS